MLQQDKKAGEVLVPGNLTIRNVAEIASKHRMKMFFPPTAIIARGDTRSRLIYTDPATGKLVIKK